MSLSDKHQGATDLLDEMQSGFATNLFSADIERNAKRFELAKKQLEQLHTDLRTVGRTEAGRRLLGSIIQRCHLYQSSFTGNAWVGIYEGERLVGQWLFENIASADPELLERVMLDDLRDLIRRQREAAKESGA